MRIYNIGSLNIDYVYNVDHFVEPGETLASVDMNVFPGGKGLNQSVALARAGATVAHGAILGENGDFLLDTLSRYGVDTSGIKRSKDLCGHAIIEVDKSGQNRILLFAGTNRKLNLDYVKDFLSSASAGDIVLVQNETNCLAEIFGIAANKGLDIAFNPSPISSDVAKLPLSDVKWWFLNEIEGAALFGSEDPDSIINSFIEKYPDSNLILTLGKRGSIFCNRDKIIRQGIFKTDAVDTTAAGDTFTGFFLASVTAGNTVEYSLRLAATASGISVSRQGASSSIPDLSEVIKNMK